MQEQLQDIYRLQAFVTTVEEGSLSAAVTKLHISQPALSARLKLLEESLNCTLLERTARGVRPTSIGKLVYGVAVDILKRMNQLNIIIRNHLELREGFVHLGGGATAVAGILPNAISEFCKKHPHIQFTLHEKNSRATIESLHDGAVDVGLVTKNPFLSQHSSASELSDPFTGLKVHGEIKDKLEIIAALDHPLVKAAQDLKKRGQLLLPMHLSRQPMILFEAGSTIHDIIDLEFRKHGVKPYGVMTLQSAQSIVKMVEKNIGLSIVSSHSIQGEMGVTILKIEGLKMERSIAICSAAEKELPPAAIEFIQILKSMYVGTTHT